MRISDWSSDVCSSDLHDTQDHEVAPGGSLAGQVPEVQAVDARQGGRHAEDPGPRGKLPCDIGLSLLFYEVAGLECRPEDVHQADAHRFDTHEVVEHVPEIRLGTLGDTWQIEGSQLVADLGHPGHDMLEMHRLAPELENALDVRMIERVAHQTPFHHHDLIPNALDHREVVVHDQVKEAVDDIVRPFPGMGSDRSEEKPSEIP